MKQEHSKEGIEKLTRLFGKTRHAYYDHLWRSKNDNLKDELILQIVGQKRESLPRVGTRKLHYMINEMLIEHKLSVGRDYLFDLLESYKLLIRNRRRKVITTNSRHWMHKYNNLTKDLQVDTPEQLWVSDITFIRLTNGFIYLSLITDAYSHKVVGYHPGKDLSTEGCLIALKMGLRNRQYIGQPLIHHSDRGCQYCSKAYVDLLVENTIGISMTENGDPYENAIAERLNGILKTEFNLYSSQLGFEKTAKLIEKSILAYNQIRPHASCDYLTPEQAHQSSGTLKKRWKNYYKKQLTNP